MIVSILEVLLSSKYIPFPDILPTPTSIACICESVKREYMIWLAGTPLSIERIRAVICSFFISIEYIAILAPKDAAFRIIDTAKDVLPWLVSPAIIIKSDFCNPPDFESIFSNPVGIPVNCLFPKRLSFIMPYTLSSPSLMVEIVVLLDLKSDASSLLTELETSRISSASE